MPVRLGEEVQEVPRRAGLIRTAVEGEQANGGAEIPAAVRALAGQRPHPRADDDVHGEAGAEVGAHNPAGLVSLM